MQIPREPIAIRQAAERLAEIFGALDLTEDTRFAVPTEDGRVWDAVFTVRGLSFVLEWKRSGSISHVAAAIHQLEATKNSFPNEVIPLVAVPYMGEAARERCVEAGLPWLDLSGNAGNHRSRHFLSKLGESQPVPPARAASERVRPEGLEDSKTFARGTRRSGSATGLGKHDRPG